MLVREPALMFLPQSGHCNSTIPQQLISAPDTAVWIVLLTPLEMQLSY